MHFFFLCFSFIYFVRIWVNQLLYVWSSEAQHFNWIHFDVWMIWFVQVLYLKKKHRINRQSTDCTNIFSFNQRLNMSTVYSMAFGVVIIAKKQIYTIIKTRKKQHHQTEENIIFAKSYQKTDLMLHIILRNEFQKKKKIRSL